MTSSCDMRLAGICRDCMKRLGIDERLTTPLNLIQVSQLPEFDPKLLANIQFSAALHAFGAQREIQTQGGTTRITYKIAKTVKETIDDGNSHISHQGSSRTGGAGGSSSGKH